MASQRRHEFLLGALRREVENMEKEEYRTQQAAGTGPKATSTPAAVAAKEKAAAKKVNQ